MKQFIVIDQLRLNEKGALVCKKPSGRLCSKVHFKQGDLDGVCGAYSLAMVFNILGVFEDSSRNSDEHGNRAAEWKMIRSLNNQDLYPNGLKPCDMIKMVTQTYSKYVTIDHDTVTDGCVTVRDRDTMTQERVKIEELRALIDKKVSLTNLLRNL